MSKYVMWITIEEVDEETETYVEVSIPRKAGEFDSLRVAEALREHIARCWEDEDLEVSDE